jgi:hypothetical protein
MNDREAPSVRHAGTGTGIPIARPQRPIAEVGFDRIRDEGQRIIEGKKLNLRVKPRQLARELRGAPKRRSEIAKRFRASHRALRQYRTVIADRRDSRMERHDAKACAFGAVLAGPFVEPDLSFDVDPGVLRGVGGQVAGILAEIHDRHELRGITIAIADRELRVGLAVLADFGLGVADDGAVKCRIDLAHVAPYRPRKQRPPSRSRWIPAPPVPNILPP